MLALWLIYGAWLTLATDFRYEMGYFFRTDVRQLFPVVRQLVPASDLLIRDYTPDLVQFGMVCRQRKHLNHISTDTKRTPMRRSGRTTPTIPIFGCSTSRRTVWALQTCRMQLGRVFCERLLDEWGFTLERYALHSVENCPDRPVRLEFDSDIQLTAPEITVAG